MRRPSLHPCIVAVVLMATPLIGCTVGPTFRALSPDVPVAWSATAAPPAKGQVSQVTATPANAATW